jgi:hypothetical protein
VKKTRTEITIEFDEVIQATGDSNGLSPDSCLACGSESLMVTPQQAAVIAAVTVRDINRWVESEMVHFMETSDGFLLICVTSLSRILCDEPAAAKYGCSAKPDEHKTGSAES